MEYLVEIFRDVCRYRGAVPAVYAWGPGPLPEELPPGVDLGGVRPSQVRTFGLDEAIVGRITTGGTPEACGTVWRAMRAAGHDLADELQAHGLALNAPRRDSGLVWATAVFEAAERRMLVAWGLAGGEVFRQLRGDDAGASLEALVSFQGRDIPEEHLLPTRYAKVEDLAESSMALLRVLREPAPGAPTAGAAAATAAATPKQTATKQMIIDAIHREPELCGCSYEVIADRVRELFRLDSCAKSLVQKAAGEYIQTARKSHESQARAPGGRLVTWASVVEATFPPPSSHGMQFDDGLHGDEVESRSKCAVTDRDEWNNMDEQERAAELETRQFLMSKGRRGRSGK